MTRKAPFDTRAPLTSGREKGIPAGGVRYSKKEETQEGKSEREGKEGNAARLRLGRLPRAHYADNN